MTVISVAKVRSILHQSAPKQQESVRLGAGVQLEFAADDHRVNCSYGGGVLLLLAHLGLRLGVGRFVQGVRPRWH